MNSTVCSFRRCEVFFVFVPFSEAAICYQHPMLREGGGSVGCGTFCCIFCGEVLVLDFRDGGGLFSFFCRPIDLKKQK